MFRWRSNWVALRCNISKVFSETEGVYMERLAIALFVVLFSLVGLVTKKLLLSFLVALGVTVILTAVLYVTINRGNQDADTAILEDLGEEGDRRVE